MAWRGAVLKTGSLVDQDSHGAVASRDVVMTEPSGPVTNRSKWEASLHNAVTGWPGTVVTGGPLPEIGDQLCHPGTDSHQLFFTDPSAPVMNRSMCVAVLQRAVTGVPATAVPGGPMEDQ